MCNKTHSSSSLNNSIVTYLLFKFILVQCVSMDNDVRASRKFNRSAPPLVNFTIQKRDWYSRNLENLQLKNRRNLFPLKLETNPKESMKLILKVVYGLKLGITNIAKC